MKNKNIIYLLLSCFAMASFISVDFANTRISSHLTMDIDKRLNLVPSNAIDIKYTQQNAPIAVYETLDQEIQLSVRLIQEGTDTSKKPKRQFQNPEANKAFERDINLEKLFKKSNLMAQFDQITFLQDSLKTINGNQFIVYEYEAEINGVDSQGKPLSSLTYAFYQVAYIKNKTYIFNFYCPLDQKEKWQESANKMMNSINIRK
jgi:hypothetical protein